MAIFLPGNPAEDRATHWYGGPDFAIEIISTNDRSRKKLDFYAKVGVKELLLVDRKPWSLELYRLVEGHLTLLGKITPGLLPPDPRRTPPDDRDHPDGGRPDLADLTPTFPDPPS